jgi:2-dehydropantoate 2-reductase
MALDAERGQPLEVEVILGEVVRMARDVGIDVPVRINQLYSCGSHADDSVQRIEIMYGLLLVVQNQILGQRLA